jgi:mono/diheme cytochrome c family protein
MQGRIFSGKPATLTKGENMRRICLRVAATGIAIFFAALALPSRVRAEGDTAKVYKTNCVLCHAADGSGSSPSGKTLKAKDLRAPEVQGKSDAELTDVITKGMGKMPAFGKKLPADAIKSLVAYIRELPKQR